jgi:hypothetical protein
VVHLGRTKPSPKEDLRRGPSTDNHNLSMEQTAGPIQFHYRADGAFGQDTSETTADYSSETGSSNENAMASSKLIAFPSAQRALNVASSSCSHTLALLRFHSGRSPAWRLNPYVSYNASAAPNSLAARFRRPTESGFA